MNLHDAAEHRDPGPVPTAASLGLLACRHCNTVWTEASDGDV